MSNYPIVPGPLYDAPRYPGRGYPPRRGEDRPGLSTWGRLAKGGSLGKSSVLVYDGTNNADQVAAVQVLQLEGDDLDALQLCITLLPPRVFPISFADLPNDPQNLTTSADNNEVPASDFPGTGAPINWPPFEAVVEWGVGGCRARAFVDYLDGVSFNVIASFVRVYAAITQGPAGGLSNTSAAYQLAAFVGPGWARTGTAQKTIYLGTILNAGASPVIAVPPFARRVTVIGCDTTTPPNLTAGTIRFSQSPDGNQNVGNFFFNGNQPLSFPVPNGGQYFFVENTIGVSALMAAVFELGI